MGQIINAEARAVDHDDVRQFFMDRGLTGQGLVAYRSVADATSSRPADRLARDLFGIDGVRAVFLYGNVLSVTKADAARWDDIVPRVESLVRNLFISYDVNRV